MIELIPYDFWGSLFDQIDVDAQALAAANFTAFDAKPPSDPKLTADVTAAKNVAAVKGNTKLVNTLDFILKYGDKALSILSKNGILKNQNLVGAGYSLDLSALQTDTTSNAPSTSNRVFNIDFSDPKVLIIVFLVLMILFYFLFFNKPKNGRR